jgi:putative two-component system hydrogenase maturation factor HypX/HoxX
MSTSACERLLAAYEAAKQRPTRVIVLMGGADFFSNGLDLNRIEAADSPPDESWRNINAMDDLCRDILTTDSHLTVSALRGNTGAGGAFLALAADRVWARRGVILNPHYKNMGNLYGSEYWSYLLPRRVGVERAARIMRNRLPLGAADAVETGFLDEAFGDDLTGFEQEIVTRAEALAAAKDFAAQLEAKRQRRAADEAAKPLDAYRAEELKHMQRNFYGFDPSYHVARHHFRAQDAPFLDAEASGGASGVGVGGAGGYRAGFRVIPTLLNPPQPPFTKGGRAYDAGRRVPPFPKGRTGGISSTVALVQPSAIP